MVVNKQILISPERIEKFDLLGQLILNQHESIILCGETGIGKTTLLNALKKAREDIWAFCLLQGNASLRFEDIQKQLLVALKRSTPQLATHQELDLEALFEFYQHRRQKIVLAIDDAARLADGLISTVAEYAINNPVLRVIFASTKEEICLKNQTDRAIDDCYFVELPSLTQQQIVDFLDRLPQPIDEFSTQNFDDKFLTKLYRHTHGVPGKILSDLPVLLEQEEQNTLTVLKIMVLVSFLVSMSMIYIYKVLHPKSVTEVATQDKPVVTVTNESETVSVGMMKSQAKIEMAPRSPQTTALAVHAVPIPAPQPPSKELLEPDVQWLLNQQPQHYTLQLIALSKRQSLLNIVQKYPHLQSELKIIPIYSHNQPKYILLYGMFEDSDNARQATRQLPKEFRHAWIRRFEILHTELK